MSKRIISWILALIVILGSIVVMTGWFLDIPVLKSILPGWVSMKFITSLSFLFSGILVMFLAKKEKGEFSKFVIIIISFSLLLLMITFLISLFSGISTGIESLMIKEAPGAVRTTIPGVPAIPTMICFILISLSGFFFINNSGVSFGSSILGMLILLIGAIAVMGYLLNLPFLYYSFEGYTSMAFHTAIFFVLLGIGIIFSGGKETEK